MRYCIDFLSIWGPSWGPCGVPFGLRDATGTHPRRSKTFRRLSQDAPRTRKNSKKAPQEAPRGPTTPLSSMFFEFSSIFHLHRRTSKKNFNVVSICESQTRNARGRETHMRNTCSGIARGRPFEPCGLISVAVRLSHADASQ